MKQSASGLQKQRDAVRPAAPPTPQIQSDTWSTARGVHLTRQTEALRPACCWPLLVREQSRQYSSYPPRGNHQRPRQCGLGRAGLASGWVTWQAKEAAKSNTALRKELAELQKSQAALEQKASASASASVRTSLRCISLHIAALRRIASLHCRHCITTTLRCTAPHRATAPSNHSNSYAHRPLPTVGTSCDGRGRSRHPGGRYITSSATTAESPNNLVICHSHRHPALLSAG